MYVQRLSASPYSCSSHSIDVPLNFDAELIECNWLEVEVGVAGGGAFHSQPGGKGQRSHNDNVLLVNHADWLRALEDLTCAVEEVIRWLLQEEQRCENVPRRLRHVIISEIWIIFHHMQDFSQASVYWK